MGVIGFGLATPAKHWIRMIPKRQNRTGWDRPQSGEAFEKQIISLE